MGAESAWVHEHIWRWLQNRRSVTLAAACTAAQPVLQKSERTRPSARASKHEMANPSPKRPRLSPDEALAVLLASGDVKIRFSRFDDSEEPLQAHSHMLAVASPVLKDGECWGPSGPSCDAAGAGAPGAARCQPAPGLTPTPSPNDHTGPQRPHPGPRPGPTRAPGGGHAPDQSRPACACWLRAGDRHARRMAQRLAHPLLGR